MGAISKPNRVSNSMVKVSGYWERCDRENNNARGRAATTCVRERTCLRDKEEWVNIIRDRDKGKKCWRQNRVSELEEFSSERGGSMKGCCECKLIRARVSFWVKLKEVF